MKSTKRAFWMSVLAVFLCVAMLVGTTFAWFTDSVTSGKNRIVAGNLDVEVEYAVPGENGVLGEFQTMNSQTDSLFSSSLWEPGHTEYVTLKVVNKGTLAFNYRLQVTPITETAGVNQAGQSFKLSDYLVFSTTAPNAENQTFANRDAAREAAGSAMKLNQTGLTKDGTLYPNGDTTGPQAQYITLVVYMPETVGNEANYMTGTTPPEIDLGINVFAYQEDHEVDSFDKNYDILNIDDEDSPVTAPDVVYTLNKQDTVTAEVNASAATVFTSAVTPAMTNAVNTTITVPAGTQGFDTGDTAAMTVEATPILAANANSNFTISTNNNAVGAIDLKVKVNGVEVSDFKNENNEAVPVTVSTYIAKGLTLNSNETVDVKYVGTDKAQPTDITYNKETGLLTFKTTHFSTFAIGADQVAYLESNNTAYLTLEDAWAVASNNQTVYLIKDCTLTGQTVFNNPSSTALVVKYAVTLDLNNYDLDLDGSYLGFYNNGKNFTIKNGTVTSTSSVLSNRKGTTTVENAVLECTGIDCAIWFGGSTTAGTQNYSKVIIAKDSTVKCPNYYAMALATKGYTDGYGVVLDLYGRIEAGSAFTVNGTYGPNTNFVANLYEDSYTSTGFYMPCDMTVNVWGDVEGAIYQRNGVLNVYPSAKIVSDEQQDDGMWEHIDSGYLVMGNCVVVEACHYGEGHAPKANIMGGTFVEKQDSICPILVINNADTADMSGTTVPYRYITFAEYQGVGVPHSLTVENTTLVQPNAN